MSLLPTLNDVDRLLDYYFYYFRGEKLKLHGIEAEIE